MTIALASMLLGVMSAMAFASFALGRYLAGSLFRVTDRVFPFGEAPPSGFERARPGARLAITLGGPLAVYLLATLLSVLGMLLGGSVGPALTVYDFAPGSAAQDFGLRVGDEITSVAGTPMVETGDVRAAIAATTAPVVEVGVDRDGQQLRFFVVFRGERRLGVMLAPKEDRQPIGRSIRQGIEHPARVIAGLAQMAIAPAPASELTGPIGIVNEISRARGPSPVGAALVMSTSVVTFSIIAFLIGSLALWPPRTRRRGEPVPASAPSVAASAAPTVAPRPGQRFLARAIDWALVSFLISVLTATAAVVWVVPLWLPLEALLLSTWGFTPGKWLLGITVRDAEARRPRFRGAFRRSAVVWAYGLGADTLFGTATGVFAYQQLKRQGTTYWDTLGGYTVQQRPVSDGRAMLAFFIFLTLLGATFAAMVGADL